MNKLAEKVADATVVTCGGSFLFGISMQNVNSFLQAGAFIVAMISGICAAMYYVRNAK